MANFGLIGLGGYVAPRHLRAIRDTGHTLIGALDPNDSVGVIDSYFPDARFFTEFERFDRFLEKRRRMGDEHRIHYMTICSPNYLHDAHIRAALRVKAHAICEKPLVINPWNLDALEEIEAEMGFNVYTILQLRLHPTIVTLKERLSSLNHRPDVELTYITQRGNWYDVSWKGDETRSGGVAMNIGIHLFDLCVWLFGGMLSSEVHVKDKRRMAGTLELERARIHWFLSVERDDLPKSQLMQGKSSYRLLSIAGEAVEFSEGFTDLHTQCYRDIFAGGGFRIADARPSIDVVHAIRSAEVVAAHGDAHPLLRG